MYDDVGMEKNRWSLIKRKREKTFFFNFFLNLRKRRGERIQVRSGT
jgi:predicted nucleotidyltransferase